jgi:hypothetical protein
MRLALLGTVLAASLLGQTDHKPVSDPKPEDAARATLSAFDTYEIVGLNAAHRGKDEDDFILSLVRRPEFPSTVNDIVVECGNSLYQPVLDRYIDGADVPLSEARQVWRNTTQNMCSASEFYEELFPLVRTINRRLPATRRLRVVAGDSPIDWNAAKGPSDADSVEQALIIRDANAAAVIEKQVLAKHRKALMLYGTAHLFHGLDGNAVGLLEKNHPGVTFVIYTHASFGCDVPSSKENDALEARMATWAVPSIARIKGTWLADVPSPARPFGPLGAMVDAYLYLGPRDLMLAESRPALTFVDSEFMNELSRRRTIGVGSPPGIVDRDNVRQLDANHLLCAPAARQQ